MGFIKRLLGGDGGGGRGPRVDGSLDDTSWYAASVAEYQRTFAVSLSPTSASDKW